GRPRLVQRRGRQQTRYLVVLGGPARQVRVQRRSLRFGLGERPQTPPDHREIIIHGAPVDLAALHPASRRRTASAPSPCGGKCTRSCRTACSRGSPRTPRRGRPWTSTASCPVLRA